MRIPMADLKAQSESIRPELDQALKEVLDSCRFVLGPNVTALEQQIADYSGCKYAVGVASGTDAIMLALAACGVKPGDEVITTPFTFVATAEVVALLGAVPVFADIDPATFNVDPESIRSRITSRTRAILPVHLYGQMADMKTIGEIAREHGLAVVADGAQAIGAEQNGQKLGQFPDAATLSFFPTKNLGAYGDGGMVLTDSEQVAEQVKVLRFHGSGGTYNYQAIGWCSRLDEMQAAILRVKMSRLQQWNDARARHAGIYNEQIENGSVRLPVTLPGNKHVWHQYTVRCARRDDLKEHLKHAEIDSAVYYPGCLHLQSAYAYLGYQKGDLPGAEESAKQVLSLPVYPELANEQAERIASEINKFQNL